MKTINCNLSIQNRLVNLCFSGNEDIDIINQSRPDTATLISNIISNSNIKQENITFFQFFERFYLKAVLELLSVVLNSGEMHKLSRPFPRLKVSQLFQSMLKMFSKIVCQVLCTFPIRYNLLWFKQLASILLLLTKKNSFPLLQVILQVTLTFTIFFISFTIFFKPVVSTNTIFLFIHITSSNETINTQFYVNYFSQPAIACSRLTIETLEQGVKYVQS